MPRNGLSDIPWNRCRSLNEPSYVFRPQHLQLSKDEESFVVAKVMKLLSIARLTYFQIQEHVP